MEGQSHPVDPPQPVPRVSARPDQASSLAGAASSPDPARTLSASVAPEAGWRIGTVLAMPLILAIRAYQLVMSPMLVQSCRFYPSCSQYAVTALRRFGLFRGAWLAARRLLRCHPWNPGGVDHVPPRPSEQPRSCEHSVRGDWHAA